MTTLNRTAKHGSMGLWMRPVYMEGFRNRSITAVVRLHDRTNLSDSRCMLPDVDVPVRFIKKLGNAAQGNAPELFPDDGTTVWRTDAIVKRICDLTADDFQGMAPDVYNPETVRYHLGLIDNTVLPSPEEVVTIWRFKHQPDATS